MFRLIGLATVLVVAPAAVWADCSQDVAEAYERSRALIATPGRAALLEQIQRAEIAHHEGDEDECVEAVRQAQEVLSQVAAGPAGAAAAGR